MGEDKFNQFIELIQIANSVLEEEIDENSCYRGIG